LRAYVGGHLLVLAAFWFVPVGGWVHALWQLAVMSASAVFLVVGARRLRPERAAAWSFIAVGMAVNSCGVTVDLLLSRLHVDRVRTSPTSSGRCCFPR
jgi:hypothetical protein